MKARQQNVSCCVPSVVTITLPSQIRTCSFSSMTVTDIHTDIKHVVLITERIPAPNAFRKSVKDRDMSLSIVPIGRNRDALGLGNTSIYTDIV